MTRERKAMIALAIGWVTITIGLLILGSL